VNDTADSARVNLANRPEFLSGGSGLLKLGFPQERSLEYPDDRERTQEIVETRRRAEESPDEFWMHLIWLLSPSCVLSIQVTAVLQQSVQRPAPWSGPRVPAEEGIASRSRTSDRVDYEAIQVSDRSGDSEEDCPELVKVESEPQSLWDTTKAARQERLVRQPREEVENADPNLAISASAGPPDAGEAGSLEGKILVDDTNFGIVQMLFGIGCTGDERWLKFLGMMNRIGFTTRPRNGGST
jgi:hypothetical protein